MTATSDLSNENFLLFLPSVKLHVEGGGKDLFTRWLTNLLILIVLVLTPSVSLGIHYQQVEEAEEDKSGREEEQQEGVGGRTQ